VFNKNLESLRGVAALMVALGHCLIVLKVDGLDNIVYAGFSELAGVQSAITRFALIFFNGGAAVTVFFVLSGYVLGLSLDKHKVTLARTFSFYLKRVFRLYPAHIVSLSAIVASMVLFHEYEVFEAASAWYVEWYRYDIEASAFFNNLLLKDIYLNHIAWSLQVELAGSLFLPLAYVLCRRSGPWVNTAALAALVALSWRVGVTNLFLFFLYAFYAGLMLPMIFNKLKDSLSGRSGTVLLLAGIGLLCFARTLFDPRPGNMFSYVLLETAGSVLIIAYLLNTDNQGSVFSRFLSLDIVNRLGRVSYSFYLLHFIILYWLANVLFHVISPQWLAAVPLLWGVGMALVTVPLTFWLSGKMYRFVEVPMVRAGKRIVRN